MHSFLLKPFQSLLVHRNTDVVSKACLLMFLQKFQFWSEKDADNKTFLPLKKKKMQLHISAKGMLTFISLLFTETSLNLLGGT